MFTQIFQLNKVRKLFLLAMGLDTFLSGSTRIYTKIIVDLISCSTAFYSTKTFYLF
jgi:hypothetical protein